MCMIGTARSNMMGEHAWKYNSKFFENLNIADPKGLVNCDKLTV
jgi:hypothetical protein